MSVADWEGAPITAVLDRVRPSAASYRVLVSGTDVRDGVTSSSTLPGATWIFSRDDLSRELLDSRLKGFLFSCQFKNHKNKCNHENTKSRSGNVLTKNGRTDLVFVRLRVFVA